MDVSCTYETKLFYRKSHYTCKVADKLIIDEVDQLRIYGPHKAFKSDDEVTSIWFHNCQMIKVPQGLLKTFPNLRCLIVHDSNLRTLTKADLADYKNLEEFDFNGNEIEFLPGDLFEGFRNVEVVSFQRNQLKLIEPGILNGLDRLKHVDFFRNVNYDKLHSSYLPSLFVDKLDVVKKQLIDKYPATVFEHLNQSLQNCKMENQDLRMSNEVLKTINIELNNQLQKGTAADLKNFLQQDETFKDFKVRIKECEFAVHKLLLAARSPVLAEMLNGNPQAQDIELVDISVDIFDKILKFLYADELPGDEVNFLHLFAAAGRLQIEELKNHAAEKLLELIDDENAFEILKLSNKYRHDGLRQKSFDEIKKKYPSIEFKEEWAMDGENLAQIIEFLRKKEAMMRQTEEEFQKLLMK